MLHWIVFNASSVAACLVVIYFTFTRVSRLGPSPVDVESFDFKIGRKVTHVGELYHSVIMFT